MCLKQKLNSVKFYIVLDINTFIEWFKAVIGMSIIEEYFRFLLSKKEKEEIYLAELKFSVSKLIERLSKEAFFIKTTINNVDAGLLIYDLAQELKRSDVVVVLDWSGIHIMSRELMIKRLAKFLTRFKYAEINYYTLQYLGVLIRDKEHYRELIKYISGNLRNELPEYISIKVIEGKSVSIERRDD